MSFLIHSVVLLNLLLLGVVVVVGEGGSDGNTLPIISAKEETRRWLRELHTNRIIDWSRSEEGEEEGDDLPPPTPTPTTTTTTQLTINNNTYLKFKGKGQRGKGQRGKVATQKTHTPVVYWHGMGDNGVHVKHALRIIEQQLPDIYVKSIQIGSNVAEDTESGYFVNVNEQVELVCEMIRRDKSLEGGYNAIGLSQGGQFLRGVAQRCPDPPMFNLISLGGQHQGIFGLPKCQAPKAEWCEIIDKLLTHVAYAGWVQKFLVQAEYWHDPFKTEEYVASSVFLADINNERSVNESYKTNLQRLQNLVLVLFQDETIVEPKQTEWFGFFESGSDNKIIPLEESTLYHEDRLGLKVMNEAGKVHFLSSPGDHLQWTDDWFIANIIKPFLS